MIAYTGLSANTEEEMKSKLWTFIFLFFLVGLIQSVDFPCFIGTIGAWSQRSSRGIISGIWATCSNVGNIIGLQTASYLLSHQDDKWENLMFYITILYLIIAMLIYCLFISDPKEVGLEFKDDHVTADRICANSEVSQSLEQHETNEANGD